MNNTAEKDINQIVDLSSYPGATPLTPMQLNAVPLAGRHTVVTPGRHDVGGGDGVAVNRGRDNKKVRLTSLRGGAD